MLTHISIRFIGENPTKNYIRSDKQQKKDKNPQRKEPKVFPYHDL